MRAPLKRLECMFVRSFFLSAFCLLLFAGVITIKTIITKSQAKKFFNSNSNWTEPNSKWLFVGEIRYHSHFHLLSLQQLWRRRRRRSRRRTRRQTKLCLFARFLAASLDYCLSLDDIFSGYIHQCMYGWMDGLLTSLLAAWLNGWLFDWMSDRVLWSPLAGHWLPTELLQLLLKPVNYLSTKICSNFFFFWENSLEFVRFVFIFSINQKQTNTLTRNHQHHYPGRHYCWAL